MRPRIWGWVIVLLLISFFIFAQQATKPPERKGTVKSRTAQIANQVHAAQTQQKPAASTATTAQSTSAIVISKDQSSTATEDLKRNEPERKAHEEDLKSQRKIVWFTGALVVVGFLQVGAMILQWCVYLRQARIMAHQAGEMTRQRITMRDQLKAMQGQLAAMESSSKQTDKLIDHAEASADSAKMNAQALINAERPWIVIEFQKIMASDQIGRAEFHIVAVNRGKTVAQIISHSEPVEVSCALPGSELPMPYPTNLGRSRPQRFLAPGATMQITDFYPRSRVNVQRMAAAGESQGGNMAAQRMVIYGEIRYSDGVSPGPKWSRYCFQHNTEQFSNIGGNLMFCGPDGYNDYT
jgi:hypothetical protein